MITLTPQQVRDMYKLVRNNGIAAVGSVATDGEHAETVDWIFMQRLQLVEHGLALVAEGSIYRKETNRMEKLEGRDVVLLIPSKVGRLMFKDEEVKCLN